LVQETVSLKSLIEANAQLKKQLEAANRRIEWLEFILEQRVRETKSQYDPGHIEEMKDKVYKMFLANPGVFFSYVEANNEFKDMYGFESADIGRRIRSLRETTVKVMRCLVNIGKTPVGVA
jgi:hypothetical protein